MNKKGFTLIELLAVIIVLGIIMIIAVPSVTKYIRDSKNESYVDVARDIIRGASYFVSDNNMDIKDKDTTYYIDNKCIETSNSSKTPYGEFTKAYVVVNYNDDGYDYYWTSVDDAGKGISKITSLDRLSGKNIESDLTDNDIPNSLGVDARNKVVVIDKQSNCEMSTSQQATAKVSAEDGNIDVIDYPIGKSKRELKVGDIVKIGNEEFFFLMHENKNMILLSRYNLKVGSVVVKENNKFLVTKTYGPSDSGYGLQSSEMNGYTFGGSNTEFKGVTAFSNRNYWSGQLGEGKKYPDNFVYDSNSIIYPYVENYKTYLESLGANVKEARLVKNSDFSANAGNEIICSTSYWTGDALPINNNFDFITMIIKPQNAGQTSYSASTLFGVRPVIVI